jgi:anti-sigma B factor antagonist
MSGKYDISEIMRFEAQFKDAMKEYPDRIALNLNDLDYIDSSGIGSLIRCMNIAEHDNISFVCYDLSDIMISMFRAAKLDQYLPILTIAEFNALFNDEN